MFFKMEVSSLSLAVFIQFCTSLWRTLSRMMRLSSLCCCSGGVDSAVKDDTSSSDGSCGATIGPDPGVTPPFPPALAVLRTLPWRANLKLVEPYCGGAPRTEAPLKYMFVSDREK